MSETSETAFDAWFAEQEGFSLRAERFDGDVAWLKAAFEAGQAAERERCAQIVKQYRLAIIVDVVPQSPGDNAGVAYATPSEHFIAEEILNPRRPMTGFLATLTPEQRTSALQGYEGDDTMGDRSKI